MEGLTDEELTDAWAACALGRSISHLEHVRITVTLLRRHPRDEAERRNVAATRANCEVAGAPERFDEDLTRRWLGAIADALDETDAADADELLRARPELARSDLLA